MKQIKTVVEDFKDKFVVTYHDGETETRGVSYFESPDVLEFISKAKSRVEIYNDGEIDKLVYTNSLESSKEFAKNLTETCGKSLDDVMILDLEHMRIA